MAELRKGDRYILSVCCTWFGAGVEVLRGCCDGEMELC